ncbi:MAG: DUF3047 domain-containing protein [Nitrospirae bacterium]|nr:DUF3047 domain-containing protein [Nitrospirota bacterium]
MSIRHVSLILILLTAVFLQTAVSQDGGEIFIREDFNSLDAWKPLYFPRIKAHTQYTIVTEGNESYLRTESNASASAMVYTKEFNVYEYPRIQWRWKVDNVYKKGTIGTKEGDDYPIRIYVTFKYDPRKAGVFERLRYEGARLIYGEYPPHSALSYVWANKKHDERIVTSPYTEKGRIILLRKGNTHVGQWQTEDVDILKDYRAAFGEDPPAIASLAVMNDSDNTGEGSVSYLDYIYLAP